MVQNIYCKSIFYKGVIQKYLSKLLERHPISSYLCDPKTGNCNGKTVRGMARLFNF
jgi:hypothetical protein